MPPEAPPVFLALETRAAPIFRAAAKTAERSKDHPLLIMGWTSGAIFNARERDGGTHWQGLSIVCWEILTHVCGGDPEIWQKKKARADVIAKLLEAADLCDTRSAPYVAAGQRAVPALDQTTPNRIVRTTLAEPIATPEPEPEDQPLSLF